MPTLSFFLYCLCLGLAYLFRISYRGWFGPYLILAMICVPVLILILSLPSMLSLTLQLSSDPHITKGAPGQLRLCFNSRSLLPVGRVRIWLRIENRFTGESAQRIITCYNVDSSHESVAFSTDYCGQIRFHVLRWECRDALGLFAIRKKLPSALRCTVLPPALPPDSVPDWETILSAETRFKPKYGGGFSEEHELRDYRPGDPSNSIHWKLSSKTDDLIVREPLEQENQQIFLVLSHVGKDDRGLEILYWLSQELCRQEKNHCIVSDKHYLVGNENESADALSGILAHPITTPCSFDPSAARCIVYISGEEVSYH